MAANDSTVPRNSYPMRRAIRRALKRGSTTTLKLATAIGSSAEAIDAYLAGTAMITFEGCRAMAGELGLTDDDIVNHWLREAHPDLMRKLDTVPLARVKTAVEQRLIRHLRKFKHNGDGIDLVLVDAEHVVAYVMAVSR